MKPSTLKEVEIFSPEAHTACQPWPFFLKSSQKTTSSGDRKFRCHSGSTSHLLMDLSQVLNLLQEVEWCTAIYQRILSRLRRQTWPSTTPGFSHLPNLWLQGTSPPFHFSRTPLQHRRTAGSPWTRTRTQAGSDNTQLLVHQNSRLQVVRVQILKAYILKADKLAESVFLPPKIGGKCA